MLERKTNDSKIETFRKLSAEKYEAQFNSEMDVLNESINLNEPYFQATYFI
jgi:hypothetical protein